jgi:hypothetical protein
VLHAIKIESPVNILLEQTLELTEVFGPCPTRLNCIALQSRGRMVVRSGII